MAEPNINDVMDAVGQLRAEFEKKSPDLAKIEKLELVLNEHEEKNQKMVVEHQTAIKQSEELKERIDALEAELARGHTETKTHYRDTPEYKALNMLCKIGREDLDPEMKALLRTDNDVSGGYLAIGEMDNTITKKISEVSNIRSIARVRTVSSKSLQVPIRGAIPTASYEGQAETGADSTSTYDNETLTPFRQTVTIPVTKDMLMDGAFDMEAEIMGDAAEAFAAGEGTAFVLGTGSKQPEGFLINATVAANTRTSSASGTITGDDVILLTGDLKVGYNPVYTLSRATLAFIRTLKSTTGQFLWQPGMNGPVANTLNGYPYLVANDMPALAANALSVAFGDFRRGYTIIDRTGISIVRDEVSQKRKAIVEFTINRWNTGQVTLPEAIKVLKCAP